ncbi:MAG: hypothetical protein NE328_22120, partial [Lentisphaeraceae bacterium]|nr:hypothetical protein [Lentisphaeraceae bacterium]
HLKWLHKGTPGFIAPEQVKGVRSTSCDIYSLGAILYNILTLKVPFSESTTLDEYLKAIIAKPVTLKSKRNIPSGLEAICLKALETDPQKRYNKVETMGADIRSWLNGFAPLAEQAGFTKQLQLLYKRHKALCLSLIAFLLILFSISAFFISSLRKSEASAKISEREANIARDESAFLLRDLKKEQKFREGVSGDIAQDYLQKSKPLFLAGTLPRIDLALEYINISLQMNAHSNEAWEIKGLLHFIRQEFSEAIECLKKSRSRKYHNIAEFSLPYQETATPLKLDQFISLNQEVQQAQFTHFAGVMRYYELKREKPLEEQIALSKKLLKIQNEHIKDIAYIFDTETMSLDLSTNKNLDSIYALQFLTVKSLNLSNTSITDLIGLRGIPIENLDISHTAVRKIAHMDTKDLRVLNIAHTKIQDIKPLQKSYLVELDIRGLKGISLDVLKACHLLKRLIVSPGQFKANQLSVLPDNVEVISHR